MSFISPLALLALLALPAGLAARWWWRRRRPAAGVAFPDVDLVSAAAPPPRLRRFLPLALLVLALAGLGVALARPQVTSAQARQQATIVLAIDTSGSMAAADVFPYRLRAAQDAAERFAEKVPAQFEVGLVTFAGTAQLVVAPTTDREALRAAIEGLLPQGATSIGDAVMSGLEAIKSAQAGRFVPTAGRILLLSDGANTRGTSVEEAAAAARTAGVPVFTVALGTPDGTLPDGTVVSPDPQGLAALAEETGGRAYESKDAASVSQVYSRLGTFIGTEQVKEEVTAWAAGIAALLLVAGGVAAWRLGPRLP
ncbi:MAG: Ca-activated chloride channel [Miltoncostaeaceae bacterium]|nr:Ca-activated chloride channel [Miltoncostaeaceae bacterium]